MAIQAGRAWYTTSHGRPHPHYGADLGRSSPGRCGPAAPRSRSARWAPHPEPAAHRLLAAQVTIG